MDRQATLNDKQEKINFLNKMLGGAYKEKFKALDTIVESSVKFGGKNDPIKIDYNKINEMKEDLTQREVQDFNIPQQQYIPRPLGTSRSLPSVSKDQISMLLGGKLTEAQKKGSVVSHVQQQQPSVQKEVQYLNENQGLDMTSAKKQLKEEFIREMVQDKDVRNEIMETILYELFGKDRMKKLLKEVLAEARAVKK